MSKILLISNFSNHNKSVVDLTIKNHYEYCSKWNIDFLYTISEYSPKNNFDEISLYLQKYNSVITIGTDILFTNFNKNIEQFIDINYSIIIQDQGTDSVNGDFIIWNNNQYLNDTISFFKNHNNEQVSTQSLINVYKHKLNIKILPPRTLQSISYYGNENNKRIEDLIWRYNDFSIHCHRPGYAPKVEDKIHDLKSFLMNYNKF